MEQNRPDPAADSLFQIPIHPSNVQRQCSGPLSYMAHQPCSACILTSGIIQRFEEMPERCSKAKFRITIQKPLSDREKTKVCYIHPLASPQSLVRCVCLKLEGWSSFARPPFPWLCSGRQYRWSITSEAVVGRNVDSSRGKLFSNPIYTTQFIESLRSGQADDRSRQKLRR